MELYLLIALLLLMVIILGVQLYNFFGSLSGPQEDSNNSKVTLDSLNKALEILQSGSTDITNYLQEFKNPMSSQLSQLLQARGKHFEAIAKISDSNSKRFCDLLSPVVKSKNTLNCGVFY